MNEVPISEDKLFFPAATPKYRGPASPPVIWRNSNYRDFWPLSDGKEAVLDKQKEALQFKNEFRQLVDEILMAQCITVKGAKESAQNGRPL